eukprot:1742616-Rhodomonas_salina.1
MLLLARRPSMRRSTLNRSSAAPRSTRPARRAPSASARCRTECVGLRARSWISRERHVSAVEIVRDLNGTDRAAERPASLRACSVQPGADVARGASSPAWTPRLCSSRPSTAW